MTCLTIKVLLKSMLIRKRDEIDHKKPSGKPIPNRIEDMSPLPQSPTKNVQRFDYSPDFGIKIQNSI